MRVKEGNTNWIVEDHHGVLNELDCVLLEYACGTGEMRNHQALFALTHKNTSHPVESMMIFGKVPEGEERESTTIVNTMINGLLIQPFERLVWELQCGRDVLHSRFSVTYHLSDHSRGSFNLVLCSRSLSSFSCMSTFWHASNNLLESYWKLLLNNAYSHQYSIPLTPISRPNPPCAQGNDTSPCSQARLIGGANNDRYWLNRLVQKPPHFRQ